MKRGLQRNNDWMLRGALFLAPLAGLAMDPKGWTLWAFIVALGGSLLWFRVRMPHEQHTQKRVWVAWGLGTGYALLLCYMLSGERMAAATLVVVFQLWLLLFLGTRLAEERAIWFTTLGVTYGAIGAVTLSFQDHPWAAAIGAGFALIHVLLTLHFSHSHSQAHRADGGSKDWSRRELRWLAPVMGLALAISLPVAWVAKTLNWERELPSIGDLPSISTSSAPVFVARFVGERPDTPYWTHPQAYVLPVLDGQWMSLLDTNGVIPREVAQVLENKQVLATHRQGTDDATYKYLLPDTEDSRFPLDGYFKADYLTGWTKLVSAWKHYEDKPLMGFDQALDALYLSIPADTSSVPTQIDLSGAQARMPRTWAMVQAWKSEGLTDQQFVDRTLAYFKDNLAYHFDHQSTRPEENQLDWFLFEDRKGVCRHFANAFALIMRMGGVRSRVKGGFMGGVEDKEESWVVRARDAHAWTEIWMDGQGWVRIDPTSFVPVEKGVPEGPSFPWSKSDRRAWVNWDGKGFGTAGSAKDTNEGSGWLARAIERVEKLGKHAGLDQDHNWLVYVVPGLALGLLLGGLAWRKRPTTRPVEEIEWERLMEALHARGAIEASHQGPRTIGLRLAQDWPQDQQHAWMELVLAYEQWRFGGVPAGDLAKRIKTWRKRVRKDFRKPGQ